MHVYKNKQKQSLLNLPAVTDAKPSYAKPKGLDHVHSLSLTHLCDVCGVSVTLVQGMSSLKRGEYWRRLRVLGLPVMDTDL